LAAKADYIVSGDKHLLELTTHKMTRRILSVNEFLSITEGRVEEKNWRVEKILAGADPNWSWFYAKN